MFEKLLHLDSHHQNAGIIWSIEGDRYLAFEMSQSGDVVKRAEQSFRSLYLAKSWLQKNGVQSISLRQSNAYFEMIGQSDDNNH